MKATKHYCYVCGDYKVSFLESLSPLEYLNSQAHRLTISTQIT